MRTVVIGSEGKGVWGKKVITYLFELINPQIQVLFSNRADCNLIVRGPFESAEPYWNSFPKPYIYWSGEPKKVKPSAYATKSLNLYTFHAQKTDKYYPFFLENLHLLKAPKMLKKKKYTLAYCNSNRVPYREKLFNLFNKYKNLNHSIHSLGKCFGKFPKTQQKVKGTWESEELLKAYSNYNFVFALENIIYPGYITEKIVNAFAAGSIPIYWGTKDIKKHFNTDSFINLTDFKTPTQAVKYVLNLSNSEIEKMLNAKPLIENEITLFYNKSPYSIFLSKALYKLVL